MLAVICPNCRHRFSTVGTMMCCENGTSLYENKNCGTSNSSNNKIHPENTSYLTSGGGCFINAPTIVNGPAIIQNEIGDSRLNNIRLITDEGSRTSRIGDISSISNNQSVITTTPHIHSGGYLIQGNNSNDNYDCSPPSGCQELPGQSKPPTEVTTTTTSDNVGGLKIQVNATVQLAPADSNRICTVNITTKTASESASGVRVTSTLGNKGRNNFNGGGIVRSDIEDEEERDNNVPPPGTPISWLMPCVWGFNSYNMGEDMIRLKKVKKLLEASGWYHQGLTWQQSDGLLKGSEVGRWLMRDSSDNRFNFAVSVQTDRGPTSVRVHYFLGDFRLDADPRLALTMPVFNCPIKMLEHYVEYSRTVNENRREVWVDHSGTLYTQIYLTKPLLKEVKSLSHLARLAINKYKLPTSRLPPLIRNYVMEYPYTL